MGRILRNVRSITLMSRIGRKFLNILWEYTEFFFHLFSWAGYEENFSLLIVRPQKKLGILDVMEPQVLVVN
jgi:hypothetical protein